MRISDRRIVLTLLLVVARAVWAQEPAMMDHSHMPIAVPAGVPLPALSLAITRDAMSGFNLTLHTDRFVLRSPPGGEPTMQELMAAPIDRATGYIEGHAHLYVNGEKIQRLYGHEVHLPGALLREGINQVTVSLNNHGHMYWTIENRQLLATLFVDGSRKEPVVHRFESHPTLTLASRPDPSQRD